MAALELSLPKMEFCNKDNDEDLFDVVLPVVARVFSSRKEREAPTVHKGQSKGGNLLSVITSKGMTRSTTRFRIPREMFLMIQARFNERGHLQQQKDAAGRLGLSTLQKMTAALRMLAYGTPADAVDEYVRIGGSTALVVLKAFCKAIVAEFGSEYLRRPTSVDIQRIYRANNELGFPGLVGSIDCTHISWAGCPKALHTQCLVRRSGCDTPTHDTAPSLPHSTTLFLPALPMLEWRVEVVGRQEPSVLAGRESQHSFHDERALRLLG